MRVLIFSTNSVWNISQSKNNLAICHKCTYVFIHRSRYSYQISEKLEISREIFEKYWNINMKNLSVTAELFCADTKTYLTNLVLVFRNFGNTRKNWKAK
jgi:hypothetical protein